MYDILTLQNLKFFMIPTILWGKQTLFQGKMSSPKEVPVYYSMWLNLSTLFAKQCM